MAISYKELFDFDGLNEAFIELEQSEKQYAKAVSEDIKRMTKDVDAYRKSLLSLKDQLGSLNITNESGRGKLGSLADDAEKATNAFKIQNQFIEKNKEFIKANKDEVNKLRKEIAGLKKDIDTLNSAEKNQNSELTNSKIKNQELAARIKEVRLETLEQTKANKSAAAFVNATADSYREAQQQLTALGKAIRNAEGGFKSQTPALQAQIKEYNALNQKLKEFDAQMGNHQRNVGNYKSGWNGLSNSINQLTRELPAFSVSAQTGFLAISNNLPIFFDEIKKVNNEIKTMRAEGEKVPGLFKQLGSSIFSVSTFLSLGVTLLTLYGKDLINLIFNLFKGKEAIDAFKLAQNDLNEALKGSEFANAIKNVNELRINIDLAKEGLIDKKDVLNQYNETIGKTTGEVRSLDEAEKALAKNADAFIKMTLYKAAAQIALEDAAKKAYEAEISRRKKLEEFSSSFDDAKFGSSGFGGTGQFNAAEYEADKQRSIQARKKRQDEEVKISEDGVKAQLSIAERFQKDAAKIARSNGFDLFPDDVDRKNKEKAKDAIEKAEELLAKYERIEELNAFSAKRNGMEYAPSEEALKRIRRLRDDLEYAKNILESKPNTNMLGGLSNSAESSASVLDVANPVITPELDLDPLLTQLSDTELVDELTSAIKEGNIRLTDAIEEEWKRREKNTKDYTEAEKIVMRNALFFIQNSFDALTDVIGDQWSDLFSGITNGLDKLIQNGEIGLKEFGLIATGIVQGITGTMKEASQQRLDSLNDEKDREVAAVGDNANAKLAIENKYNTLIKAEKRKQAVADRNNAMFKIAINSAVAAVEVLPNIPLSIIIGALGLAQLAIVASKPLPQFYKGTDNAPEGPAEVAERGPELLINPDGSTELAKKRQIKWLRKGTKVKTADQTAKILSAASLINNTSPESNTLELSGNMSKMNNYHLITMQSNQQPIDYDRLINGIGSKIKDIPFDQHYFDDRGYSNYRVEANTRIKNLNAINSRKGNG